MPYMWHDGWGMGWFMLHGIGSLILVAVLVVAVVYLVRGGSVGRHSSALDVLEERYARGEIDRDEYLQKKADLRK